MSPAGDEPWRLRRRGGRRTLGGERLEPVGVELPRYGGRVRWRTLSMGCLASSTMPSSVSPIPARPKCPAFPTAGCAVLRVSGTIPGSDSLCPATDFSSHLIRWLAAASPTWTATDRRASPVDSDHLADMPRPLHRGVPRRAPSSHAGCWLRPIHRGSPLPPCLFDAAVFASCCGLPACHLLT